MATFLVEVCQSPAVYFTFGAAFAILLAGVVPPVLAVLAPELNIGDFVGYSLGIVIVLGALWPAAPALTLTMISAAVVRRRRWRIDHYKLPRAEVHKDGS